MEEKKKYCRSCEIEESYFIERKECLIKTYDFHCLMCNGKNNILFHPEQPDLVGTTHECNYCHNYICYYDGDGKIYSDELYYSDFFIKRDFEENKIYVKESGSYDAGETALPFIEFSNKDDFIKRIKNLLSFI